MARETTPLRRRVRAVVRGLSALLVLALAGLFGLTLALSLGFQRDRLRERLEAVLGEALGVEIEIGALEGPLYPGFTLRDAVVRSDGRTRLSVERLAARVRLARLWPAPLVELAPLELSGVWLGLTRDAAGRWDVADLLESAGEPAPDSRTGEGPAVPWRIRKLRVREGRVELRWTDAAGPQDVVIHFAAEGRELSPTRVIGVHLELAGDVATPRVEGRLAAELRADGRLARPALRGLARVERPRWGRASADALVAELDASGDSARAVLELVREGRNALRADASLPYVPGGLSVASLLESPATRVTLEGRDIDLAWLAPFLPAAIRDPAGRADLDAELRGAPGRPVYAATLAVAAGSFELAVPERRFEGIEVRLALAPVDGGHRIDVQALRFSTGKLGVESDGPARLQLGDEGVAIERLRLRAGRRTLQLTGGIATEQVRDLKLELAGIELEELAAWAPGAIDVGGRVFAQLQADGPLPLPALRGWARVDAPRLGAAQLGSLRAEFESVERSLRANARLEQEGRAALEAHVLLPYDPARARTPAALWLDPSSRLALRASRFELAWLAPWLPARVRDPRGAASGRAEIRGGRIAELTGTLAIADAGLVLVDPPQTLADLDAQLEVERGRLALELRGTLTPLVEGPLYVRLEARPEPPAGDRLRVELDALEFGSEHLAIASEGPGALRLALDGPAVTIEQLRLRSGTAALEVSGGVAPEGARQLRLVLTDLDLADLSARALLPADLGGVAAAEVVLDGPFPLAAARGRVRIRAPRYGRAAADVLELELEPDEAVERARLWLEQGGRELLRAEASVPRAGRVDLARLWARPETRLELHAERLDLAWLGPLLPREVREPAGTARAAVQLRGGQPLPDFEGGLELIDGSFELPVLGRVLAPWNARVALEPTALRLESLTLGDASHPELAADGSIRLAHGWPSAADLRLHLRDLALFDSPRRRASLHGDVFLRGPLEALEAVGRIELREARLTLPEPDDRLLREIRVIGLESETERTAEPSGWTRLAEAAAVDLRVVVPRNSWVRGQGLEVEVTGEVGARKPAGRALGYSGAIEAVRGRYRILGREFRIEQGLATFTGATRPDPLIHVVAVHRVGEVTIVATLSGSASQPEVRLSSNPSMTEEELLAYLLFGRPAAELDRGESTRLQATAARLAANLAAEQLAEEFGVAVPLDTIDLSIDEASSDTVLEVGSYITTRVFVRVRQRFGAEPGQEVEVEWRLTPGWSVRSDTSTTGVSGADLIYTLDY